MDFFSLNHGKIGARDRAGKLREQVRYVARQDAASVVITQHVPRTGPGDTLDAEAWARQQEKDRRAQRKNGRIAEIVKLALPRDTNRKERAELVKGVLRAVTKHRTPALAAIHDKSDKDKANPHAHILICDQDVDTGARVFGFSEYKSVERLRKTVAKVFNAFAERTRRLWRVDHRSFRRQGVPQKPTRHEGPSVRAMRERGVETHRTRDNAAIRQENADRAARLQPPTGRRWAPTGRERQR